MHSLTNAKQNEPHRSHVYLTGYRGSGKTSVAKELSLRVGIPWIDLDAEIVSRAGQTIAEIFRDSGEESFRDWETKLLRVYASGPVRLISLGGGAILRAENRRLISSTGFCVWLDADPQQLAVRLSADTTSGSQRPSLTGRPMLEEIQQVMRARRPLYRDAANLHIDTSQLSIAQVAEKIKDSPAFHPRSD